MLQCLYKKSQKEKQYSNMGYLFLNYKYLSANLNHLCNNLILKHIYIYIYNMYSNIFIVDDLEHI